MAIPSREIGWSTKANLLWQISKQLQYLNCVTAGGCSTTTSTTTIAPAFRLTFTDISFANALVGDATNVNDWNTYLDLPTNGTPFDSVIITGNEVALYGGSNINLRNSLFSSNVNLLSVIDTASCIITISNYCFENCSSLTTINFPSVNSLGNQVFAECTSLQSIKFDSLVSLTGNSIFSNIAIQTLTSTNFPVLTIIGQTSFGGCLSLTSVNLPSVTSVGYYGFGQCTALTNVQLPNVSYTAQRSFRECSALNDLYMPSLIYLGENVGDNLVFEFMTGATLTFTIPAALMTCNAGNPDGDIQYLQANNTVTIVTV